MNWDIALDQNRLPLSRLQRCLDRASLCVPAVSCLVRLLSLSLPLPVLFRAHGFSRSRCAFRSTRESPSEREARPFNQSPWPKSCVFDGTHGGEGES